MINLEYIREHRAEYEQSIKNRQLNPADFQLDHLLALSDRRKLLLRDIDQLRAKRNAVSKTIQDLSASKRAEAVLGVKELKTQLKTFEDELGTIEQQVHGLQIRLPNRTHPAMPTGKDETGNVEIKTWGGKPKHDFTAKDHLDIGTALDLIDVEASARISGSRFYFLKNELVLMQFGMFQHVFQKLVKRGFILMLPPVIIRERALYGTGYFPFEGDQIYKIGNPAEKGTDEYLVGTSEQAIVSYHDSDILKESELPKKYLGHSVCFRREAGSHGKDVRGIKRVHQFEKLEMIYFTTPETSQDCMKEILAIEEEILQDLELPYHVLEMCSGDVGMPTYRKWDVEVWLSSQQTYMEVMSNSDLHEYHARRLNIRYRPIGGGDTRYVHTLSSTALTNTRPLAAILDNFQQADGSVRVPKILQPYVGTDVIRTKRA